MMIVCLNSIDLDSLKSPQVKQRGDFPATFSANQWGEVWPFSSWGLTPEELRTDLRGELPLLDEIVDMLLQVRQGGGRFFVNETGAYYRRPDGELEQFVEFEVSKSASASSRH